MLQQLIQEGRRAMTLAERFRVIVEIVAYVMMTGPKGGQFYYTHKGTKVYRKLGGQSGKARKRQHLTGEDYDNAWKNVGHKRWLLRGDGERLGKDLKELFGDKAPSPDEMETMFSDEENGVGCELIEATASGTPPRLSLRYGVNDENGRNVGGFRRAFYLNDEGKPTVYHSIFSLRAGTKGKGIGGVALGKMLETYKKLGVEEVKVTAAGGGGFNGGYTWARFGFEPEDEDMPKRAAERVKRAIIDEGVPSAQADWIQRMHMRDLYTTAGIRIQVPTGALLRSGKPRMKTVKVGRNVTKDMTWGGKFDVNDTKAVARWERQVAKAKKQRKKILAKKAATSKPKAA